jgi:Mn2+/Fe2+ NRAMP family transporter
VLAKLKSLGPGLLYAGAAIGVSHLVQSTQAGARYGYILIIGIILAHIFKYPFFAIGPRYANQTNTSLVSGYAKIGKWAIVLLASMTLLTMFSIQAAVTMVTAGLAQTLTGIDLPTWQWSAILLTICLAILRIGKFKVLDHFIKIIMIVLALSTVLAFILSFRIDHEMMSGWATTFSFANPKDMDFLISFIGWMPAPLDLAISHSIWTVSNYAIKGRKTPSEEKLDFNVGFFGTAILGVCFLVLGANTMFGSGVEIQKSAGSFASQLVSMFTSSLGPQFYFIILVAAFATMFSTTLTVLDALPRVMAEIGIHINPKTRKGYLGFWQITLGLGAIIILVFFVENMLQMVYFATTISFLTAPVLAYLSYRLVMLEKDKLTLWSTTEKRIAQLGIVFLALLSILFLV